MGKKNRPKNRMPQPSIRPQSQQITQVAQLQRFSGPLPHPATLEHYNKIVPNAADRIIQMAESQSKHRQELEKAVIQSDIRDGRLGLHYGLVVGISGIIGATICITFGYTIGGSVLGGSSIFSLACAFIYGSSQRRNERKERLNAELKK